MCATLLPTGTNPAHSLGLSQSVGLARRAQLFIFFSNCFPTGFNLFCDPLSSRPCKGGLLGVTTSQALCVAINLNRNNTIGDVILLPVYHACVAGPSSASAAAPHNHRASPRRRYRLPASWKEMCYAYDEPAASPALQTGGIL